MSDITQTNPADSSDTRTLLPLLALSLSIGVSGRVADNIWLTWQQVCEAFRNQAQRISETKDGLLITFAHFLGDYKITSQVTDLFAVLLDFDHQTTEQMNNSIQLAQRLSTRGIAHTTWSDDAHGPYEIDNLTNPPNGSGSRCFRIIIPLDQPVSAAQWSDTWRAFANTFETKAGATPDPQCKNANRRYYVPSIKQEPFIGHDHVTVTMPTLITWGE